MEERTERMNEQTIKKQQQKYVIRIDSNQSALK